MQVQVGGNLDFAGLADWQVGKQSAGQIERDGGGWEIDGIEQQIAHALVAQGDTGIHTAQIDCQSSDACCINSSADTSEVVHFNIVGIFSGDKIQVGLGCVERPGRRWNG